MCFIFLILYTYSHLTNSRQSGSSSEEDLAFEDSFAEQSKTKEKSSDPLANSKLVNNQDYDEALDVTGSTIESFAHDDNNLPKKIATKVSEDTKGLKSTIVQDQSYDEALEVSASTMDSQEIKTPVQYVKSNTESKTKSPAGRSRLLTQDSDQIDSFRNTKTSTTDNQHWDEALDLSSDGEQSLDTDDGLRRSPKNTLEKGDSPPLGTSSPDLGRQEYGSETPAEASNISHRKGEVSQYDRPSKYSSLHPHYFDCRIQTKRLARWQHLRKIDLLLWRLD